MVLGASPQNHVDGENEEQGNYRPSSQPRTTQSQNVSIKVAFLRTLHADRLQLENDLMIGITRGSRRRVRQRLDGLTAYRRATASVLRKLRPCAEIVTHGDSSFTESPEFGDD